MHGGCILYGDAEPLQLLQFAIGDPISVFVGVSEHINAERQNLNHVIGGIQW